MSNITTNNHNLHFIRWINNWDSRARLIAAMSFIFGVVSLTTPTVAFATYMLSVMVLLLQRISVKLLFQRYLIITPFLLLMTVPLLWNYSYDNAVFSLMIIIKAFTSMTVITIVLESQSLDEFMNSLAGLKLPPVLITILILTYRYVFMFLDDIQRMMTAVKSRFFRGGVSIKNLKIYGQLTASLLIRAIERSDRMYKAMASRGFAGKLTFSTPTKMNSIDFIKILITVMLICFFIIIDRMSG